MITQTNITQARFPTQTSTKTIGMMSSSNRSVLWRFLALLLAAVSTSNANKCLPEEMIRPCTCFLTEVEDEVYPVVRCSNVRSLPVLHHVIAASLDRPFPRFQLHKSYLNYIPVAMLLEKGVRHLEFSSTAFVDLFDRVPEENNKLQGITSFDSKILRGIDWKLFKNLRNLTRIFLEKVPVKKLDKEFLEHVQPSLEALIIIESNIYKLDDRVFSKLTKIKEISIIIGRLTTLKRSMFPKENIMQTLNFEKHRISSLPDDIFDDMPHLQIVLLSGNPFKTLTEKIFGNFIERNIELAFLETEVVCNCDLRWVVQKGKWKISGKCGTPDSLKDKDILEIGDELDYCDDI